MWPTIDSIRFLILGSRHQTTDEALRSLFEHQTRKANGPGGFGRGRGAVAVSITQRRRR